MFHSSRQEILNHADIFNIPHYYMAVSQGQEITE